MKRLGLVLLISAVFVTTTVAAEKTNSLPPPDVTETISVTKAIEMRNALQFLLGIHDTIVGQGSGQKIIQSPYDFNTDALWALIDDKNFIAKFLDTAEEARKALISEAEAKNGGPLQPKAAAVYDANGNMTRAEVPSEAQTALTAKVQELFGSERPITKLFHVKLGDLNLKDNRIPGDTLESLVRIIDR